MAFNLLYKYGRSLVYLLIIFLILSYCLYPSRFASHYNYMNSENIAVELEQAYFPKTNACKIGLPTFAQKHYNFNPTEELNEEPTLLAHRLKILPGGQWRPYHCQPLFNVAIVLPYRNREFQLSVFMNYIHLFLHLQNLEYRVFVVEQSYAKEFNRAKLFNIGFVEANKIDKFHCFIFQDIDLIPQNFKNIYACTKMPRHMSASVNTLRYNLPYTGLFGGAIAITKYQFKKVNGFSNVYFGWGAEDDDFYKRLQSNGLSVTRFSPDISQYYMLNHRKESPSVKRFTQLKSASKRFPTDGINNLKYTVLSHHLRPLYSWILVNL